MGLVAKMTEYVQQMYQNNTGAQGKAKNGRASGNAAAKETKEQAAVYEPGSQAAEKSATYQKPVLAGKKEQEDELKANLEKIYSGLSKAAKEYLGKLKEKFGNMDFFVANCETEEEMNRYFAMGSKDYTCVISSDLLEKMATDEEVRAKYEGIIENADESIEEVKAEIKEALGAEAADKITNIGITVNDSGAVEYFAKLKDSNDAYYAKLKEKRAEAKEAEEEAKEKKAKGAEKDKAPEVPAGTDEKEPFWIRADSREGLIDAIREVLGLTAAKEAQDADA